MGFYLSKRNAELLGPILLLLKRSTGRIELKTPSPKYLIGSVLRPAAHGPYPELMEWIFKVKENHVLCIRKDEPLLMEEEDNNIYEEFTDEIDYLGIINHLIVNTPDYIEFLHHDLSEKEIEKLRIVGERMNYEVKVDKSIKMKKNV